MGVYAFVERFGGCPHEEGTSAALTSYPGGLRDLLAV